MSIETQQLLELLPAIHRIRDAEIAERAGLENGPLADLMAVVAEQLALMEENIEQSYNDLFIETCADWLVPYIGDLIGYQSLYGSVPEVASPRAEVAHTIALRRRKGTVVVLEQLARDVTRWDARAVEFFQNLGWTQNVNHNRDRVHFSPDLRKMEPLSRIGSAFNSVQHTVDVRRVESNRGRFNIPNIGIFLWRLQAYSHTERPALRLAPRRYLISPLGNAIPLYSHPRKFEMGLITELAAPENVPEPLSRLQLHEHLDGYYGLRESGGETIDNEDASIILFVDDVDIPRDQIQICDLRDEGMAWAHEPPVRKYAIDPVLGRVALPPDAADPAHLTVTYHTGFSADLGGGAYERQNTFAFKDNPAIVRVPDDHATIQLALNALDGMDLQNANGVVEIVDNGRYEETLTINVAENGGIELRAANERNPHLALTGPLSVSGSEGSRFTINGILVSGNQLMVPDDGTNELSSLEITHCTWVPGRTLDPEGKPNMPEAVSLSVAQPGVTVSVKYSIMGALRAVPESKIELTDSIVDATDAEAVAFADLDDNDPGATLSADASTVIGKIHAQEFGTVSNCILLARLADVDSWNAPVWVERRQTGCVRFSFLPFDSITPRRYRCQPDSADSVLRLSPRFTSLNYGNPAYGQLNNSTGDEIRRGADDEGEMGAFHHLYAPQRDQNLRIRLREYLRVGLEAGLFYES